MPTAPLADDGAACRRQLPAMGLSPDAGTGRGALVEFLAAWWTRERLRRVERTG